MLLQLREKEKAAKQVARLLVLTCHVTVGPSELPLIAYKGGRMLGHAMRYMKASRDLMVDIADQANVSDVQHDIQKHMVEISRIRGDFKEGLGVKKYVTSCKHYSARY